jgi:hypothetical protein
VLRANGNFSEADHFDACVSAFISMHFPAALLMMRHCSVVDAFLRIRYATAAVVQARSDPEFLFGIGIHAAAEAMIGTGCSHKQHAHTGLIIIPISPRRHFAFTRAGRRLVDCKRDRNVARDIIS